MECQPQPPAKISLGLRPSLAVSDVHGLKRRWAWPIWLLGAIEANETPLLTSDTARIMLHHWPHPQDRAVRSRRADGDSSESDVIDSM